MVELTCEMSWQGKHPPARSPQVWDFGWGSWGFPRFYPGLFVEGVLLMGSRVSRAHLWSQAQGAAPGLLGWPTLPLKTPEGFLLPCQEQLSLRMVSPVRGTVFHAIHLEPAGLPASIWSPGYYHIPPVQEEIAARHRAGQALLPGYLQ